MYYLYQTKAIQLWLKTFKMTRSTIAKRLAKFTGSKSSIAYQVAKKLATGENKSNIIRPVHTSGSGRFTTNLDYTFDCKNILTFLKLKFETGNDSPRGGLTGNYIKIITIIK
jgi:hypothetical protein